MWQPRNGCDGRLMTKILITTIQVNLVSNPRRMQHKFTQIVVIKIFAISLSSQPFLGRHVGFHIFSQWPSWGLHTFLRPGYFELDLHLIIRNSAIWHLAAVVQS